VARLGAARAPAAGYALAAPGQVLGLQPLRDATPAERLHVLGLDSQVWAAALGGLTGPYALAAHGQVKAYEAAAGPAGPADLFALGLDDQVYLSAAGGYVLAGHGQVKLFHPFR
jgi:hypothetical protein